MKNSTVHWLYTVPGRKRLLILVLILVQGALGASGVFYALLLREIVDAAVGADAFGFWKYLFFLILLVILQQSLNAVIRWLNELSRSTLENVFKRRLTDTLLHKDYLLVSSVHSGEWLNRLTNDTVVVSQSCVEILPGLAGMIVKILSASVMLIVMEPLFALVMIPGGVLFVLLTWIFRKILKRLHKDMQVADGKLRILLQERIGSLLMIRSFAAEPQTQAAADAQMQAHQDARMRKNHFYNLGNLGFGLGMSGMYLLGIAWCSYGILKGTISFGTLTAMTQLITQLQVPLANISGYLPRYFAMLASAERLMEAETIEGEDEEAEPLQAMMALYEENLLAIGLKDTVFAYYPTTEDPADLNKEPMPAILQHLSLEIRKGDYVAFTGYSGCGKSTVLKLLMCVFRPGSGERYYVDRNGRKETLTAAHRRLFAYVPQGNQLMSGTIREIVSFAEPTSSNDDDRLAHALRIACAEEFVSELPDGIDTLLGEKGAGLSEGQMQRLAIARAVFCGSPILLLDESTSALDGETESRLLQNLREMTDKTVIIVTHRPAALKICDRVLRFTESGVVEI